MIGVVSCYFKQNYGSVLQAYATQMALDKLGENNETINISGLSKQIKMLMMKYLVRASLTSDTFFQKYGMVVNLIKRRTPGSEYSALSKQRSDKFNDFTKGNFRLSEVYASKNDLSEKCGEKYSAVLVGSDQLWLPANIEADYYTLNFVPGDVNSIAYATSFGVAELPKSSAKKAAVFLKKIKHISVREETGQKLVYELTGRRVPIVCDPTLLFTGEEWMSIQQKEPIIRDKYILCYFLGKNGYSREFAKELRKKTGYKIVALAHLDEYVKIDGEYSDETPFDIDPADFINLIRNAEYICTDSFHCSAFSILYEKKFFAFRRYRKKTKQSTNNRLDNLFDLLGLKGKIIEEDSLNAVDHVDVEIDYGAVSERLNKLREESYAYLEKALSDTGSTDL